MLSGSCKLVWIISPGLKRPISARQTVDPAEKTRYEPSHLDLHYLSRYPYQSTGSEGLTSVPTCDSSIWGRARQRLLEDCATVKDSDQPARPRIFHYTHEPARHEFSIIRMSLIWAYQRAPPDQRVTSEDSDLASLINTGWSESEPAAHWLFLKTLYHSDGQYSIVKSISKQ